MASATASFSATFPRGQASVLNVLIDFALPQVASLFPLIDGEEIDRIRLATADGKMSSLAVVTASGREIGMDQLNRENQLRIGMAFQAMRERGP